MTSSSATVMMVIALRMSPPGSVERWQEGAYGEAATAKELDKLPPGWEVLHDLRNGDFNFDHVVVGPPGVFLLNSKWSSFRLDQQPDGSLLGVHPDDESVTMRLDRYIKQAKWDAVDLSRLIQARGAVRPWVQPVIVWWGDYPSGGKTLDGVAVVAGKELLPKITAQRAKRATDLGAVVEILRPGKHRRSRRS